MEEMTFFKAIKTCFRKYANFKGRARRAEYWFFELFEFLIQVIGSAILGIVAIPMLAKGASPSSFMGAYMWVYILFTLVGFALLVPSLSVTTRRLHDTDRSGWWLFAFMVLLFGGCCLFGIASLLMENGMEAEGIVKALIVISIALIIPAIPFAVVLLIWMIQKGTVGPNRYGDDPKRSKDDENVVDVKLDAETRKAAKADDYMPSGMKSTLMLLLGAVMLTSLSSCEGIDSNTLIGRWELKHAEVYGTDMPMAEGDIYTFRLDGTYTIRSGGKVTSEGTWDYGESLLTLYSDVDEVIGATYDVTKLTSTDMTLEFDFGFVYGAMDLVKSSKSEER